MCFQVKERVNDTHHYCDVFTEELLAPLGELAFVRLDENTAEKVSLKLIFFLKDLQIK